MKKTGGYIVFELTTRRIIKIHNGYATALTMLHRLGTGYALKETADRFYYEVQGYVR